MLPGCSAFLPRRETADEGRLPPAFAAESGEAVAPDRWWEAFGCPELNGLLSEALAENLTLRQAWARLDQAGAVAIQVESSMYPDLTGEAGASYERRDRTTENEKVSLGSRLRRTAVATASSTISNAIVAQLNGGNAGTTGSSSAGRVSSSEIGGDVQVSTETKAYSLGLAASYELDLWGRIWANRQAAHLDVQTSYDDLQTTAMTLAAEIVSRWLSILELQAQQELLRQQLETNRTYLDLVELRFRKSMVSALDVYQQRQIVAAVEKQLPLLAAQEQVLRHELAVLLGKPPGAALDLGTYNLDDVPPLPAAGLPASLLINRPDIRAAYARLRSADFDVAAARADQLPAIRLTGQAAYSAGEIEFLFDDWFANLAAGLTAPLFDGFRREAEVTRTRAVVEERLAAYRLAVLTAIREVEDALLQERQQRAYLEALQQQLEYANNALREADQRYRKGLNDYLPVLTALEATQSLTRDVITAKRELLVYRVNLYRALGGTWSTELQPPPRLSEEGDTIGAEG
jgi:NodT family efflux transporter outer membrane factor (OMF) lipoprotein